MRLRDIGEARIEIDAPRIEAGGPRQRDRPPPLPPRRPAWRRALPWAVLAGALGRGARLRARRVGALARRRLRQHRAGCSPASVSTRRS